MAKTERSNLVPMPGRVIVRRLEPKTKTEGGIVLPDTAQERLNQGTVVALGEPQDAGMTPLKAPSFDESDTVLFGPYAGQQVEFGGEVLLIMHFNDVLGKIV